VLHQQRFEQRDRIATQQRYRGAERSSGGIGLPLFSINFGEYEPQKYAFARNKGIFLK
jgi:hypothetical protein